VRRGLLLLLAVVPLVTGAAEARPGAPSQPLVEVVVALEDEPLALARPGRTLAATGGRRLSVTAPASRPYLRRLAETQAAVEAKIEASLPAARVTRRYRVVANGLAVLVPRDRVTRLGAVPGVRRVYPSVRYRAQLDRSPQQIGAPALWGGGLENAGQGLKIGIIDDGLDHTHTLFNPAGYTMPAGFPKGQTAYTTAKVIVARAFPPPNPQWRHAAKPFDPEHSSHATHVAGIAAGNANTAADGARVSGVAPRAYLGNYKALTIPTDADVGLDGNSPQLVAAIEAAVADGMDVINLSLGEPEIEPSRDVVVQALGAATRAGVVAVVAAGNDFGSFGRGSVTSPGTTPDAITVAAVTTSRTAPANVVASFSSSGPTPLSLQLKPEMSAPGVGILSAAPQDRWTILSGTSMAAPHVAGAAALLKQRHPTWTPAQIKSALAATADPVLAEPDRAGEAATVREGAGRVNLARADNPLIFATPVALSFGLVAPQATVTRSVQLTDAGGGAGEWAVRVEAQAAVPATAVTVPPTVTVPGALPVTLTTTGAAAAEAGGFVVLTRGAERRRIPYWFRVSAPALARARPTLLRRQGVHRSTTRGGTRLVSRYRYPESPTGLGFATELPGPERIFRVRLTRAAANFGVVVTSQARGVRVEPRVVRAGDENRLVGYTALPFNLNPYLRIFEAPVLVSGAILPAAGQYDIVFDSPSAARAGAFTFDFWIGDVRPPTLTLRTRTVRRGGDVVVAATDPGSGVDRRSIVARVDGREQQARFVRGQVLLDTAGLARGRHSLVLQVSDYQESRNMENVGAILPNTRILRTTFTVR
jgi:subtilisin family serine protease